MNVTAERMPDSQVILTIEVDPDRVEKSMDQAYRRVLPRVRVPGFRPGKAPRRVLERHVGREALLHEALDKLVPEIVDEAIKAQDLHMVDQPDLEISSLDPVVIKATVPVKPTIDLGAYRDLRIPAEPVTVEDADVDSTLEDLRRRYATIEPVERPAQEGDRVRVTIRGEVEGRQVLSEEDAELQVRPDALASIPGVYDRLLGMTKDETAEFDATLPEDYRRADLAGKPIHYTITVLDVKAEILPDLNDDFAKEVGEGFASLAALRERLATDARSRREEEARRKVQEQAVEQLVAGTTFEYPPQLVEREIEHMLRDITRPQSGNDPRAMERFLQQVGRAESEIKDELRPTAEERVKRTLALARLAELEGITVSEADIEAELNGLGGGSAQGAQLRQIFDTPSGREMLERQVHSRRTLERLAQIAAGEAPDLPEPAAPAAEGDTAAEAGETTPEPVSEAPAASDTQEESTPAP